VSTGNVVAASPTGEGTPPLLRVRGTLEEQRLGVGRRLLGDDVDRHALNGGQCFGNVHDERRSSDKLSRFHDFIKQRGPKSTRQRDEIAGIGFSTVYRTMKLLCESGLVSERHFRDGEALYENVSEHHDHCICTSCGKIIEFENEKIEELQEAVARKFGFRLVTHKMELYGLCAECRKASEA
jgi:Fe2+ or Zn2+ uptake regulation protein